VKLPQANINIFFEPGMLFRLCITSTEGTMPLLDVACRVSGYTADAMDRAGGHAVTAPCFLNADRWPGAGRGGSPVKTRDN